MVKSCKGRQKIEMVRIQKECNRMVTYSKRRAGVFKKASELATLCGAEIAIIVFSPGKKAYSFGHPSIERVLDRYLTGEVPQRTSTQQLVETHRNVVSQELNMQLIEVFNEVEMEKTHGQELDRIRRESQSQHWWESPIEGMNLAQLDQLKTALQELKQKVLDQAEKIVLLNAAQAQQTIPANAFAPNWNAAAMAFAQAQRDAASFPPTSNPSFPPASNAAAFPPARNALLPAPNAADFPTYQNACQPAGPNVFPPSPNSNAGAFESRPDLNPRFRPSNQPAARMFNNEVVPFGFNSRFGNNGSF